METTAPYDNQWCESLKSQQKPGLIERLLCKLLPYTDITREGKGIYLRRFFIYPRNKDLTKNQGKGRIYLHKFYRGDEDEHLHDHPWPFTSLILTNGYWEETRDKDAHLADGGGKYRTFVASKDGELRIQMWYKPWSILHRPAAWRHRVVLDGTNPVWTIVKTGVKERSWGFWIKDKICPWRYYDNSECLVEPQPEGE